MAIPRSDELAANKEVEQSYAPKKVLDRITPLLSNFIPAALAAKGISMISPRIGKFLRGITSSGFNLNEGLQYLRGQLGIEDEQEEEEQPQSDPYQPLLDKANQMQQGLEQRTNAMLNEPKPPAPGSPEAQQWAQQFNQKKMQQQQTPQTKQGDSSKLITALQESAQSRKRRQ